MPWQTGEVFASRWPADHPLCGLTQAALFDLSKACVKDDGTPTGRFAHFFIMHGDMRQVRPSAPLGPHLRPARRLVGNSRRNLLVQIRRSLSLLVRAKHYILQPTTAWDNHGVALGSSVSGSICTEAKRTGCAPSRRFRAGLEHFVERVVAIDLLQIRQPRRQFKLSKHCRISFLNALPLFWPRVLSAAGISVLDCAGALADGRGLCVAVATAVTRRCQCGSRPVLLCIARSVALCGRRCRAETVNC